MFSDTLLDHFQHPRYAGELPNANVSVEVTNPVCGDVLQLAAIIERNTIREVRFLCQVALRRSPPLPSSPNL